MEVERARSGRLQLSDSLRHCLDEVCYVLKIAEGEFKCDFVVFCLGGLWLRNGRRGAEEVLDEDIFFAKPNRLADCCPH